MAGFESCARRVALVWASAPRYSPLANAKTTPFTIVTGTGEIMSREAHDGRSAGVPFSSTTVYATMAPFVTGPFAAGNLASGWSGPPSGASTQRVPAASSQVASAPAAKPAVEPVPV